MSLFFLLNATYELCSKKKKCHTIQFPNHWNPSLTNVTYLSIFFFIDTICSVKAQRTMSIGNGKSKGFVFLEKVENQRT